MAYVDDGRAQAAPLARGYATRVLTLTKIVGVNITPVEMTPGYYQCRVPNGTSADTVTMLAKTVVTDVADTALTLPAGNAAAVADLMAAPGDAWFLLHIDSNNPFLACAWNGAADSTLIMTRVL